ncbi:MAG: hypothetical protein KBS70_08260 [Bacteroidales bacterium]|nr:hypothetical protein [Candidatus Colicola equi]
MANRIYSLSEVKALAKKFLDIADENNEQVSAYLNGSEKKEAAKAYDLVREYERKFINAFNAYYDERFVCCLNYELAESML